MKFSKRSWVGVIVVIASLVVVSSAFAATKYESPAVIVAALTGKTVETVTAERESTGKTYEAITRIKDNQESCDGTGDQIMKNAGLGLGKGIGGGLGEGAGSGARRGSGRGCSSGACASNE